jgi:midasin
MIAPMSGGAGGDQQKNQPPQKQQRQDANPHRSLGDALKSWKDRLNVVGDASEDKDNRANTGGADDGPMGNEYEFERNADESGDAGDDGDRGGIQTLADATEEQALQHSLKEQSDADERDADDVDLTQMQDDGNVTMPEEGDQKGGENDDDDEGREKTGKAAQHRKKDSSLTKKDVKPGDAAPVAGIDGEEVEDDAMDDDERVIGEGESGEESKIALQLENTSLKQMSEAMRELTADDIEQARVEAEQSLTKWREKSSNDKTNEANAQNLWRKLEQLTTALSAELAEKLRLILEPTLASRLQGDFKTGKRLNMRKIIPYIASDFRKDKIWLRRSRPSARKYQVMLAIDDSRSMAENHCGHIALESMVLLARAMARLEVGEIGVVGFGAGANAVRTLHPLGAPFTDQEGPSLVSKLSFAEDNTLADKPMVQLLETMSARLSVAREQIRGGGIKF